jgi:hypothetical protein
MTEIALPNKPLRTTPWDGVEDICLLAIGYSIFHCVMVAHLAGRNAEAIVAFARAQPSEATDKPARTSQIATDCATLLSVEERLALDERRTECQALGETMGSLTMPLRRELILMSGVVC